MSRNSKYVATNFSYLTFFGPFTCSERGQSWEVLSFIWLYASFAKGKFSAQLSGEFTGRQEMKIMVKASCSLKKIGADAEWQNGYNLDPIDHTAMFTVVHLELPQHSSGTSFLRPSLETSGGPTVTSTGQRKCNHTGSLWKWQIHIWAPRVCLESTSRLHFRHLNGRRD